MTEWRARFFFKSFADLPSEISNKSWSIRCFPIQISESGESVSVVDVHLARDDIKAAYFESFDIMDEFTDAVSFVAFAPASYEVLALTLAKSELNVPFRVIVPVESFKRSRVPVNRQKIEQLCGEKPEEVAIALRAFRCGVSAHSPYEILRELWTSVETMGAKAAELAQDYNESKCSCGAVKKLGYKSAKHAKLFFRPSGKNDDNVNYKKLANDAYGVSNTLEHGGKLRDTALREKAESLNLSLQSAAASAISEGSGLKTDCDWCQHLGFRFITAEGTRFGPGVQDCNFRPLAWDGKLGLAGLSSKHSECKPGFEIAAGIFFPFPIHPLGLPDPAELSGTEAEILERRIREMNPSMKLIVDEEKPTIPGVSFTTSGPVSHKSRDGRPHH